MKFVSSVFFLLFSIVSIASAEVIDVNIKGIDDGTKTNRQQDYREAVMNAKLQAIEQAGASIESITKVENFELKYDAIEAKSKAILLPGFQIIDIGYIADGTYQIVLFGKIQTGGKEVPPTGKSPSTSMTGETRKDGRFIDYQNGTVLDTRTNLMWATMDNGTTINWQNAKSYCENYRGGGYTDWRMPTQYELAKLYDSKKSQPKECLFMTHDIHVATELIEISCFCVWAAETRGSEAAYFGFDYGFPGWSPKSFEINRALPVRSNK